jgi:hypothetical protein
MSDINEPDQKRFPWVLRQAFRAATLVAGEVPVGTAMVASSIDPKNMDIYFSIAGFASGLVMFNGFEVAGSRGPNFGKRLAKAFNGPRLAQNIMWAALVPITAMEMQFS